jgi:hypothetical protein
VAARHDAARLSDGRRRTFVRAMETHVRCRS